MRIGYKYVKTADGRPAIAKLEILGKVYEGPFDGGNQKRRASKVRVLEIYLMEKNRFSRFVRPRKGKVFVKEAFSPIAGRGTVGGTKLTYRPGDVKVVRNFYTGSETCAAGIHFFNKVDEACDYAG